MSCDGDKNSENDPKTALKKELGALDVQRLSLEAEAEGIIGELTAEQIGPNDEVIPPMGVDTPLIDSDGFPRADIDVYRARTLRHRLSEIKFDHKAIMTKVEENLRKIALLSKTPEQIEQEKEELRLRSEKKPKPKYDPVLNKWVVTNWDGSIAGAGSIPSAPVSTTKTTTTANTAISATQIESIVDTASVSFNINAPPFAKIDSVSENSPASKAGLKEGDLIIKFGTIDYTTPQTFQQVAQLVPQMANEKQSISVSVLRKQESQKIIVKVSLTPRPWNGRGLIGCHIIPYNE